LREDLETRVRAPVEHQNGAAEPDLSEALEWLCADTGIEEFAAIQAVRYTAAQVAAVGFVRR